MATPDTETGVLARLRAAGPLGFAVATLTVLVVVVCAITSLGRLGAPFPGFFVWENLFVPAVGGPTWTGVASGLEYHSWLVEADGTTLANIEDLQSVLNDRGAGEKVLYRAERKGHSYEIAVPLMRLDLPAYAVSLGIYLFDAIILTALGLVLLYTRPRDPGVRGVFYFCCAQALYLSTSVDLFGPYHFRAAYFFFAGLTPTCTFYMISHFPVARTRARWEDPALVIAAFGSLAFGVASYVSFFNHHHLLLTLDTMVHVTMAAGALAAFAFFARHFAWAHNDLDRERAKIVLVASLGAFLPTMVFLLAFYFGNLRVPFNFLALPFVLFPIGIGYAVARHDLFGVDRVIKRAIAYAATTAVLLTAYLMIIGGFDVLFENATQAASRVAEGGLIAVLIVASGPSHRRLQRVVDRLYDRRRYNYREVVSQASQAFATELEFSRLVPSALTLIDEALTPVSISLVSIDENGAALERGLLLHEIGGRRQIEFSQDSQPDPVLKRVARGVANHTVLRASDLEASNALTSDSAAALQAIEGSVAVGFSVEDREVGLLIVGPRRAGGLHTSDDIALLRTIADQLAVALTNARSYDTIDVLNRDLASKNVDLETANTELRAAQRELVLKERLAAVGELAGAVAHTIRNPLAGMRAAAQQAKIELGEHPTTEIVDDFIFETDRLNHRIGALLDFSRPFEPSPRRTKLAELSQMAVQAVSGKAKLASVTIQAVGPQALTVNVDFDLFEQLWIELLSNAVEAATPDGRVVTAWGDDGHGAWIEVRDSGAGIPPEKKDELFRLFFTTKPEGTGIGLATVKKVADRHRATLEVFDAEEGGAGFRVRLPSDAVAF
ncbi:MAG: signal transduction histidine kinase [Hyphomicrobiaceae bacterium]|jgi:signal transduction histidine kinase